MKNLLFTLFLLNISIGYTQEWHTLNTNNSGLLYNSVFGLYEDNEQNIWVGIPLYGAQKFDRQNWETYSIDNSGMPLNQVMCISQDANGNFWFGSNTDGAAKWDGQNWTHYTSENSNLPRNGVNSFFLDSNQNFWIGTQYGGVVRIDNQQNWTVFDRGDGLSDNDINTIFEDSQGIIWFGTGDRMTSYDGQNFTTYNVLPQYGAPSVIGIYESSNGDIWFVLSYLGMLKYDGVSWTHYSRGTIGFESSAIISSSVMDENENILFTTYGEGLFYKDPSNNFSVYPGSESLPNHLNKIIITENNEIAIGTYFSGLAFNGQLSLSNINFIDEPNIVLYPNPISDRVNIQLMNDIIKSIIIHNQNGQKILKSNFTNTVDVSNLPNGLYYITIFTVDGIKYYKKFLKKN